MSDPAVAKDVMSELARIEPGSTLASTRALRPDVVRFMQSSDDAVFRPAHDAGLTRAERAAAALRIARLLHDGVLSAHYEDMLSRLESSGALLASVTNNAVGATDRWARILAHVDRLTSDPGASEPSHLAMLSDAGLSSQAIVALSQLIAHVNFQARVRAGLAALGGRS